MDKKGIRDYVFRFTNEEKHHIIQDYLTSGLTKRAIWKKYTGRDNEHGKIVEWMRQFGYNSSISPNQSRESLTLIEMSAKKSKLIPKPSDAEFENVQLKKRIADLERQLKDAEMKAIAYSSMIDIAEKEFKIPIKKKFNTKP